MSDKDQSIDYLAMAQFLKPRGYSISETTATYPGGLMCFCADVEDAYQMALGHFLAGELGRKWKDTFQAVNECAWQIFDKSEFLAIETAMQFYEILESGAK